MFRRCPDLARMQRQINALLNENTDLHLRAASDRALTARLRRQAIEDAKTIGELRRRVRFLNDSGPR